MLALVSKSAHVTRPFLCPSSQQTFKLGSKREANVLLNHKGQRVRDRSASRPPVPAAQATGHRGREEEAWPRGLERQLRPAGSGAGPDRVRVRHQPDRKQEGKVGSWARGGPSWAGRMLGLAEREPTGAGGTVRENLIVRIQAA